MRTWASAHRRACASAFARLITSPVANLLNISVIGIDNHDMSEFFELSTIDQQVRQQGVAGAKRLLALLDDPNIEDHVNVSEEFEWPVQLVVRSSTARPAPGSR